MCEIAHWLVEPLGSARKLSLLVRHPKMCGVVRWCLCAAAQQHSVALIRIPFAKYRRLFGAPAYRTNSLTLTLVRGG